METAIRITISLGDAREGIDRILDNPYFECLQRTATNQWESERFDNEDEDEADDLYELKETIKEVHKCIDIYTKERDQRKEAGTWKKWGV